MQTAASGEDDEGEGGVDRLRGELMIEGREEKVKLLMAITEKGATRDGDGDSVDGDSVGGDQCSAMVLLSI